MSNANSLFGLNSLVQSVGPAPAGHHATSEFIHDDYTASLNNVVFIPFEEMLCTQRLLQMPEQSSLLRSNVLRTIWIANWSLEQLLDVVLANLRERHCPILLIGLKILGVKLFNYLGHLDIEPGIVM